MPIVVVYTVAKNDTRVDVVVKRPAKRARPPPCLVERAIVYGSCTCCRCTQGGNNSRVQHALDYRASVSDERSDTAGCALTRSAQTKKDKPLLARTAAAQESIRRGRPIHGFFLPLAMLAHEGEIWTSGSDAGNFAGDDERSSTPPPFFSPRRCERGCEALKGVPAATKPFARQR